MNLPVIFLLILLFPLNGYYVSSETKPIKRKKSCFPWLSMKKKINDQSKEIEELKKKNLELSLKVAYYTPPK